jgi:hypothetical protein
MPKGDVETRHALGVFSRHGDTAQRDLIATLIRRHRGRETLYAIAAGAHSINITRWAVEGCARIIGRKYAALTKRSLTHEAMTVRLHALIGIGLSGIPNRYAWIELCLKDSSGGIRLNAIDLLADLHPRLLDAHRAALLADEKSYIRKRMQGLC